MASVTNALDFGRERFIALASLLGVVVLAWLHLWNEAARMEPMPMGTTAAAMESMSMQQVWSIDSFLLTFLMWSIMMVGMMLPSVAPTVLIYAGIARKAASDGQYVAAVGWFVIGYLLAWVGFSAAATALQWQLDEAMLLSPMMASSSAAFGASLLIAAGVYQFLPIKDACLTHCRSPVHFISAHWRAGSSGAVRMGLHHGAYCLGCCWVLMGLLFLGGVMNLLWIAAITGFVLLEKLLDFGRWTSRLSGAAMASAGVWLLLG